MLQDDAAAVSRKPSGRWWAGRPLLF